MGAEIVITQIHDGATLPLQGFDCGLSAYNRYLAKQAATDHKLGTSRTYIATIESVTVGYCTITRGGVACQVTLEANASEPAPTPAIPVSLISRLAVDKLSQKKGVGTALLLYAVQLSSIAAKLDPVRAIITTAFDEGGRGFIVRRGFILLPGSNNHYFLPIKDATRLLYRYQEALGA